MQLAKSNFMNKTNQTFSSLVRNASWEQGWLRTFMQAFFCIITVASFIMILYMAVGSSKPTQTSSRCEIIGCRVVCNGAPYNGLYEEDIFFAVTETESYCPNVALTLNHPTFRNHTMHEHWLSRLPTGVFSLEIIGGNLRIIAPQAFMSRFSRNIRRLTFEFITFIAWNQDMLIGLSDLQELVCRSCTLISIESNALQPVERTLKTISITSSGYWDPINVTGSSDLEQLSNVVFSSNNFNAILRRESFSQLSCCTILYLNSCRIHAIGPGTFDTLVNIQMLHLNDNFLQVLPVGLFDHIIPVLNPRPRINLKANRWLCECSNNELRRLTTAGLLLVDPVCHYPAALRGQTFTQFLENCNQTARGRQEQTIPFQSVSEIPTLQSVYMDEACQSESVSRQNDIANFKLIFPVDFLPCNLNTTKSQEDFFNIRRRPMRYRQKSNKMLQTSFAMKGEDYSLLEVAAKGSSEYGLVWYQDKCAQEIYCVASIPDFLRVYNVDNNAEYTFCPWILQSGSVDGKNCIFYSLVNIPKAIIDKTEFPLYFLTALLCFSGGALIIYVIILKFPYLLKGSKRILFVKHKNVDALVLPPKVPLRSSLEDSEPIAEFNRKNIFSIPDKKDSNVPFVRSRSVRSYKSIAPSYISALHPTNEQLTEWRLRHHFASDESVMSIIDSSLPGEDDNISYCSLHPLGSRIYESFK